jgi:PAS domain S-box-containing protein
MGAPEALGGAAQDAIAEPLKVVDELRILLVDDRPENLSALEAVLAPLGLPLVMASSGGQALRLLLEHDFAVILLDVRMPGVDGIETARLVKRRERTRDIPIIFLTAAQDDVQDVVRGYEAGAVDYVLKPFDPDLLRTKVSLFVELQRSRRALQRSESLFRASFDNAPIGKTLLDGELRIVRVNPAFAGLLGRDPRELEGVAAADLSHPDDRDTLVAALRAIATRQPGDAAGNYGVDLRLRSSTGEEIPVALVGSALDPAELAETLLLAQWVDLSARRRAEQVRAELMLEQSARTHAEAMAERLGRLQALTDALGSLALEPLLAELAVRIAELFGADASEVRVGEEGGQQTVLRAAGGEILTDKDHGGWPKSGEWVEAPMQIERLGIGAVALHLPAGRPFTSAERSVLRDAADRAALAIRQAQLYEEEHRIAVELQRGLLPKRLPLVPGVKLAARYQAAGGSAEVGGDWYDAFALSGGRLGIVVGDVAGRGIPAASTMGQTRSVTRAFALADGGARSPGQVLTRLNRYQLALDEQQLFTIVYAIVDPRAATVSWANAGHLPPLIRAPSGAPRLPDGGGYPIGVEDLEYESLRERLGPGGTLVLYTDGLVERRGESLDDGFDRLARAVKKGPAEPEALCDHLLRHVLPSEHALYDDVTILLASVQ